MKIIAIALGSLLTAAAATASAQVYYGRAYVYDPYWAARADRVDECWNPRAGRFEEVRPGEFQDDLDFTRCRVVGELVYPSRGWRDSREECWNPRARAYETVRPGERQYDLDFSRCRIISGDRLAYRWR